MKKTPKPPNRTSLEVNSMLVCEEEASDHSRALMEGLFDLQHTLPHLPQLDLCLGWEGLVFMEVSGACGGGGSPRCTGWGLAEMLMGAVKAAGNGLFSVAWTANPASCWWQPMAFTAMKTGQSVMQSKPQVGISGWSPRLTQLLLTTPGLASCPRLSLNLCPLLSLLVTCPPLLWA